MRSLKYNAGIIPILMIAIAISGLQIRTLFASAPDEISLTKPEEFCTVCIYSLLQAQEELYTIEIGSLELSTPSEATFEEEMSFPAVDLAPVAPEEASFDENSDIAYMYSIKDLAPETPAEADFND